MPLCSQGCGKPSVGTLNNVPLCVDCIAKLQHAHAELRKTDLLQLGHQMAMLDHAEEQMAAMLGLPRLTSPIRIPAIPSGPMTLNNIKIDNSTVGSLNTGSVRNIDVNLTQLHKAGNDRAKDALQALTQSVIEDRSLAAAQRNELLEQIAYLTSQATAAAPDRKPAIVKATLEMLGKTAATITSLGGAWKVAEPILKGMFS